MDDDIYEHFGISEWDLENEFNPNRFKRKITKKQQIYGELFTSQKLNYTKLCLGIWASSESEDEDQTTTQGKHSKGPINFVSGGFKENEKSKGEVSEESSKAKQKKENSLADIAGLRGARKLNPKDSDFGKWEAHTKGIGAKLLLQMGYQPGKGLGKNLQGITAPIEASKRPGHGSVGFYGPEHKQSSNLSNNKNEPGNETNLKMKKKKASNTNLPTKQVLKLVDEVLTENSASVKSENDSNAVKVIDMTGPQQRVLSGYHEIHRKNHSTAKQLKDELLANEQPQVVEKFELEKNLDMLLNMSEDAISANKKGIKNEKDKIERLEEEKSRMYNLLCNEKKKLESFENMITALNDIKQKLGTDELNIQEIINFCNNVHNELSSNALKHCVNDIISSFLFPYVEKQFQNSSWNLSQNEDSTFSLFSSLKCLLLKVDECLYESLLWDIWMPAVRRKLLDLQTIRVCDDVIAFLDKWKPLLPQWLLNNIIEQMIIPRIEKEVEEWNPLTDSVPIHSWIHPWLPLINSRSFEVVYIPIRQKLSNALLKWHPSDCSAKLILEPWKNVWASNVWDSFMLHNIVPKLELVMQSYDINPQAQRLDEWNWVMAWQNMLPPHMICSVLEKYFFPKWLNILYDWLSNNPNFDEVSHWYVGWKKMLPEHLSTCESVKDAFNRALEMMNVAVSSPMGISAYTYTPFVRNVSQFQRLAEQISAKPNPTAQQYTANPNFKQLLERKAEELSILFMPIANKYQEAKQVYTFGNVTIYISQQVIFMYKDGQWTPTSLQSLIDAAIHSNF
ncbi:tuftelin-interacting protein 11-like protein [Leptotrombidium deliense]|uniref:Tuftelin-interacting protein 11-like protein n=1 Tax=Leptotrombidium deliense TaxID=299467 RepID=A0A443SJL5_9ACAR|nr:tuftelin-interacting protein 11-like protein [Leptotrombidium deliense]